MTPFSMGNNSYVYSFGDTEEQLGLRNDSANDIWGVRPVINLDKNVTISSGNGTIDNPYVIET